MLRAIKLSEEAWKLLKLLFSFDAMLKKASKELFLKVLFSFDVIL